MPSTLVYCGLCMWRLINIPCRFVTLFAQDELDVDLRTLRAIRVLRPLKLVSGIPSKFSLLIAIQSSYFSQIMKT